MKLSWLAIYRKVKSLASTLDTVDKAWQHYDARKVALQAIREEQWYKYIVEYREKEATDAMLQLCNKECKDVTYYQARHNTAMQFLDFLDNISSM